MAFTYEYIDGQRVETNVAAAFRRMAPDFKRDTGCTLHIAQGGGTRTDQEQINIFLSRYVTAGNVNGRKVYDTRVWNGTRYYRVSSAGTVAVPKTSNHEENGPNGPRSIDIYDSGSDAGVTRRGTARDLWMQRNAGNYGFENEGYNFSEPWHKTFRGVIGGSGAGTGGGAGFSQEVQNQQAWMKSLGINIGSYGADGIPGPDYRAAVKVYQQMLVPYGYTGLIDGQWGDGTQTAHAKLYAEKQNPNGTPAYPLPAGKWFGPEAGGDNSVSGWHGNREDLRRWQQRMKDRGWIIDPDGLYGPKGSNSTDTQTGTTAKLFQKEKGLTVDGQIGAATWKAAWEAPVTPPTTPVDPPTTPVDPGTTLDPAAPWKSQPVDSPLATWVGSPNYNNGSKPAADKKDWIVLHWFGSDANLAGNDSHFQNPGEIKNGRGTQASSQYGVGATGGIHQYVLEKDYAHTNGHTEANSRSITIEHEGGPNKPITQLTIDASIKLVADIAKRHGIAKLVWLQNIFPHNNFVATQCPGNLDVAAIVTGANKLLEPPVVIPDPEPEEPDTEGEKLLERARELKALNNAFFDDLIKYAEGE